MKGIRSEHKGNVKGNKGIIKEIWREIKVNKMTWRKYNWNIKENAGNKGNMKGNVRNIKEI